MLVIYIYVALASYNTGYLTLGMGSLECMVDEAANVAVVDGEGKLVQRDQASGQRREERKGGKKDKEGERGGKKKGRSRHSSVTTDPGVGVGKDVDWRALWAEGTDAVMDIPVGGVCEILYGQHSEDEDVSGNAHDR